MQILDIRTSQTQGTRISTAREISLDVVATGASKCAWISKLLVVVPFAGVVL